jgi:hypothetical protein
MVDDEGLVDNEREDDHRKAIDRIGRCTPAVWGESNTPGSLLLELMLS